MSPSCWQSSVLLSLVWQMTLSECGQGGGQRGMIEVPRDDEDVLGVLCLQ